MKTALAFWENKWTTSLGGYVPGERVVMHGKDMFTELKEFDWMSLLIFGITGRLPDEKQVRLLSAMWAFGTSYPDPRLWNNRIGTLAGVARSTGTLGVSAGIAVSEAIVYGQQPMLGAAHLFLEVEKRLGEGEALSHILTEKMSKGSDGARSSSGKRRKIAGIPGFGRPVSSRDERIDPLMSLVRELGFDEMPVIRLAFEIEKNLRQRGYSKMYLNVGGLMAALMCDQGFAPKQQYYLWILCFSGGITFCAVDAAMHPEGSFFPLRCSGINYKGKIFRKWKIDIGNQGD